MSLTGWVFRPALLPTLVTLLLLPILLSLGFWQLRRADEKQALQVLFESQVSAPAVALDQLEAGDPANRYRRVGATGRYDSDHQILLDNQIQDGQPGYHVYTPLRLKGTTAAILVNRGWIPMGESRRQLPAIAVTSDEMTVSGRLSQPANPGLRLGPAANTSQTWPQVVLYMDYQQLSTDLGYSLEPAVILLDAGAPDGYRREWQPTFGGYGPERHRGYALQWFSLALALLVIYGVVNIHRRSTTTTSYQAHAD